MAYSATSVFPEPVGAATSTLWPASRASRASVWKRSRGNPRPASKLARTLPPFDRADQGVDVAAGAVVGATVESLGREVFGTEVLGSVVGVVTVSGVELEPESRLGRRNHTSAAVTTMTASDARTA